jgi:hypothetical protein
VHWGNDFRHVPHPNRFAWLASGSNGKVSHTSQRLQARLARCEHGAAPAISSLEQRHCAFGEEWAVMSWKAETWVQIIGVLIILY